MSTNDDDRDDDSVQEQRIKKLKAQARQAAGGQMMSWESDVLSTDEREQFWQRVMHFENAPLVSDFQRLTDAGMQLPEPDTMNDEQLTATLWEVIHGLASMRVFLSETDHLSDRELYTELWQRVLREKDPVLLDDPVGAWHVDLLGGCSEDDIFVHMKYYADERYRQQMARRLSGLRHARARGSVFSSRLPVAAGVTTKCHQMMEMTGRSEKRDGFAAIRRIRVEQETRSDRASPGA